MFCKVRLEPNHPSSCPEDGWQGSPDAWGPESWRWGRGTKGGRANIVQNYLVLIQPLRGQLR